MDEDKRIATINWFNNTYKQGAEKSMTEYIKDCEQDKGKSEYSIDM